MRLERSPHRSREERSTEERSPHRSREERSLIGVERRGVERRGHLIGVDGRVEEAGVPPVELRHEIHVVQLLH